MAEGIENSSMGLKTVVAIVFSLLALTIGGTTTLVLAQSDINENHEDIEDLEQDIEDLEESNNTQYADIKRGLSDNADAFANYNRKMDMLIRELQIREVISETAADDD